MACTCMVGGSLRSLFFLLKTAIKDRPQGPPTPNRQPPTANRQPPTFEVEKVP